MGTVTRRKMLGMAGGAAALAALTAAGCGGDDKSSTTATSPAGGGGSTAPATSVPAVKPAASITFWSVHPANSKAVDEELIKRFQAKYPEIKVSLETAGANYEEVSTKFQAALASKSTPDIVMLSDVWWFKYFAAKTISPMNDLLKQAQVDTSDYQDVLLKDYQFQGEQWAMPYARSTPLFYYNKQKWSDAGLPDRGPKTWDEMDEWGAKLQAKAGPNEYALTHGTGDSYIAWTFHGTIWQFGGHYSDDKFKMLFNSPEGIDAGNYIRSQIYQKKYANVTAKDEKVDFQSGLSYSIISSTGGLTGVVKNAPFPVGTGFLPEKKQFGCPTGGAGLCIPSGKSKEQQLAAMLFIGFVTNAENTAYYSQNVGYMPVRKSAVSGPLMADFFKANPAFKTAVDQLPKTQPQEAARVYVPGGDSILGKGLMRMMLNNEDAKNVWPDVVKEMDKAAEPVKRQIGI